MPHIVSLYFYKMFATDKSMETESGLVVCGDQETGKWEVTASYIQDSFWGDENILELDIGNIAQLCYDYEIVYFRRFYGVWIVSGFFLLMWKVWRIFFPPGKLLPISPSFKTGGRGGGIILLWPWSLFKCIIKVARCACFKIYVFLFLEYSIFW